MADEDEDQGQGEQVEAGFKNLGVVSSCFAAILYDASTDRLQMVFNKGGSYIIEGIPNIEVERWINSGSPGGYFNSFVRGQY
jgi:hypothetical protein